MKKPINGKGAEIMKRRLAAAILTATVTAGAVTLPAAAEWDRGEQDTTACVETVGTPRELAGNRSAAFGI